jgi:hypothetical protein
MLGALCDMVPRWTKQLSPRRPIGRVGGFKIHTVWVRIPPGALSAHCCRWPPRPFLHAPEKTGRRSPPPLRHGPDRHGRRPIDGPSASDGRALVPGRPPAARFRTVHVSAVHRLTAGRGAVRLPARAVPGRRPHHYRQARRALPLDLLRRHVARRPGGGGVRLGCSASPVEGVVQRIGCAQIKSYSTHWTCLFPHHGPGRKYTRTIALEDWQQEIVDDHPGPFLRGLIHSDGCRMTNWTQRRVAGELKRYECPRYFSPTSLSTSSPCVARHSTRLASHTAVPAGTRCRSPDVRPSPPWTCGSDRRPEPRLFTQA